MGWLKRLLGLEKKKIEEPEVVMPAEQPKAKKEETPHGKIKAAPRAPRRLTDKEKKKIESYKKEYSGMMKRVSAMSRPRSMTDQEKEIYYVQGYKKFEKYKLSLL